MFGYSRKDGVETIWIKGATGARMIHGIASTSTINGHKYSLNAKGCRAFLPVPLLSDHASVGRPIGRVVHLRKTDKQIYVRAIIDDEGDAADYAWKLIESGEYKGLSGAAGENGLKVSGQVDGVTFYERWTLSEVSVCRRAANPDCWFEIFKSERG